jgi:hypothetical protein
MFDSFWSVLSSVRTAPPPLSQIALTLPLPGMRDNGDVSRRLQGGRTQIPPDTDDFAGEGNGVSQAVV